MSDSLSELKSLPIPRVAFSATDKLLGRTAAGAGGGEEIACTAFARTLLDDATAADARTTLGVPLGVPDLPADPPGALAFLNGVNAWSTPTYAGLSGIPSTFAPSAHASSHTTGADKIATGTPDGTKFLRDDFAWAAPGGSGPAFPVGSVFIAVVSTNPNTLLGYGTWSAIAAGKVLIGLDSGDTDFDTVEETGGAKTVASSAQTFAGNALGTHQHAAVSAGTPTGTNAGEASHTHAAGTLAGANVTASVKIGTGATNATGAHTTTITGATAAGSSHTHTFAGNALGTHQHDAISAGTPSGANTPGAATSVVQPYFVCYFWKRTA